MSLFHTTTTQTNYVINDAFLENHARYRLRAASVYRRHELDRLATTFSHILYCIQPALVLCGW